MEDSPKTQLPIAPLDEIDLDEVSGGANILDLYKDGINVYSLITSQAQAALAPFASDLKTLESEIRYKNILATLAKYDSSKLSIGQKADFLSNSWNQRHQGQYMSPEMAQLILSMENKYDRAAIMSLSSVDDMMSALTAIYGN